MLRVQLLGPVEAFVGDAALSLGGPKQRTVLAVLAIDPGKRVSVDRLIEAVWGDDVPERASRSLSTYVSNLRGVVGDVIVRDGNSYVLAVDRSQVDATDFADRVAVAHRGDDPALVAEGLRSALGLWVGFPFGGVDGHHVLEPEVTRLAELRVAAFESSIEAELATNDDVDLAELDRLILEHPHREKIRGLHMRALYSAGRQAEALTSYKAFRDQLASDLGIDPSRELQELELQILQQDPALSPRRPSPVSSDGGPLPVRYSSFVGRDDEIAAVSAAISTDRLVTVVGPGGIGKSSLVVEAARRLDSRHLETVARVPVDTLAGGEVMDSLARALGVNPDPGVDPMSVIVTYLAAHPHLVVLDGCEAHLEAVANLVDALLSSSSTTQVVGTSREPLGLAGESVIRVDGLDDASSVELFLDRAKLDDIDDDIAVTVGALCAVLEGMPLAIELAAARAQSVALDRLAERIDDLMPLLQRSRSADDRHGSIAAALGWSYDLLQPAEQLALRRLSLFPSGFDRRDAEAVLDDPYAEDMLARLVEVSLVQPADQSGRYRMLEPVRQYAAFLLAEDDEAERAVERYARWIADEAQRVSAELLSPQAHSAAAWVHNRRPDIIAAIDSALKIDQPDPAVEIVASIGHRFARQGEHLSLIDRCLAATSHPNASETAELAIALAHTAWMLWWSGRSQEALVTLERAERCAQATQDRDALATAANRRIILRYQNGGSAQEAVDQMSVLVAGFDPDDVQLAAFYLWNHAVLLRNVGRFAEAEAVIAERGAVLAAHGVPDPEAMEFVGEMLRLDGDLQGCIDLHLDAIDLYQANYSQRDVHGCWQWVALVALRLDDTALVDRAIAEVRRTKELSGAPVNYGLETRFAAFQNRFSDVLQLGLEWSENLASRTESDRARYFVSELHSDPHEESVFFEILLPVARALEETGRIAEAHRIAREAPGLMAQSEFQAWEAIGEAQAWADLLDRLGGDEPEGLTVDEAFYMVHGMLKGDTI